MSASSAPVSSVPRAVAAGPHPSRRLGGKTGSHLSESMQVSGVTTISTKPARRECHMADLEVGKLLGVNVIAQVAMDGHHLGSRCIQTFSYRLSHCIVSCFDPAFLSICYLHITFCFILLIFLMSCLLSFMLSSLFRSLSLSHYISFMIMLHFSLLHSTVNPLTSTTPPIHQQHLILPEDCAGPVAQRR